MEGRVMSKDYRSTVAIARLLNSEGFSDHVANCVEKFWLRSVHRKPRKYRNLDKSFGEHVASKLDDGQKLILGKFIAEHKAMSFQTGLRIGLTVFATKNDSVGLALQAEVDRLTAEVDEYREIVSDMKTDEREK